MSDYLANLVAKARNLANAMQPRPASRFEPLAAVGTSINGRGADGEFPLEDRFTGETSVVGPPTTLTPLDRLSPAGRSRIDAGRSNAEVSALPGSVAYADARHDPVATSDSSFRLPIERTVTVKAAAMVSRPDTTGDARLPSQPANHPESVFTPQTQPPRPVTVISRERVMSSLGAAPLDRSAATSAVDHAPTIKVSIGRVEVRAIMPASPAPRPAASRRASLSLGDYLKRQGERKR